MRVDDDGKPAPEKPNAPARQPPLRRNQKLTAVIAGRSLRDLAVQGSTVSLRFDDGSLMTVSSDGGAPSGPRSGRVRAVRQGGTTLAIDFDDGGTLTLGTQEETSSVIVRDRSNGFEYAD